MSNPKKSRSEFVERQRRLSQEELERQIGQVAADLMPAPDAQLEEDAALRPAWIAPRQLVRILAPFVSMN